MACAGYVACERRETLLAPRDQKKFMAVRGEYVRERRADARRRAGDQRDRAPLTHGRYVDRFAAPLDLLEQLEIVADVRIVRIARLRRQQRRACAPVITAQHIGEALVVHDLWRVARDARRLPVGAVG